MEVGTMKISVSILTALLISVKATIILDESLYKADSVLYTAKNDIVDIHFFLLNVLYIVERSISDEFNNIYALQTDEEKDKLVPIKVLENGKCITSDDKTIFFGASDGIYSYNFRTNKTEKYGNITADIEAIQKDKNNDILYVIATNQLSKVTEKGTRLKKVESVNDVQEIVLDNANNVYLFERKNSEAKNFEDMYSKPKVIVGDTITDIKGLPDKYNQIKLIRNFPSAEGVLLVLDKQIYRIFSNGTSVKTEFVFENVPTAFYLDIGIIQLFSYDRRLYQHNLLGYVLSDLKSAFSDFFETVSNH